MKAMMYIRYPMRSLKRGGQRTVLAIFCIAIGVMAIVALQLVGQMISSTLTDNVRDANGGDIAVQSSVSPFKMSDLTFFEQLKRSNAVTNYTPTFSAQGSVNLAASTAQSFTLLVVEPGKFPLVTPPIFTAPSEGRIATLLKGNQVIVDQNVLDRFHKRPGDSIDVHVTTHTSNGLLLHVKIAGVVKNAGVFAQLANFMVISVDDYRIVANNAPMFYDTVDVTTANQAQADIVSKAIQKRFRLATVVTANQALKDNQGQGDLIKHFLEIAGLLALLIGGIGIVNTMQVLLSRRKTEIAILKTAGYRWFDLYLLFGLEAGLLGLIGGGIGSVMAVGLSYIVRSLVQHLFPITISFAIDPIIIGGGILIGLATAVIFGLMPIIQAASVRPVNVIRELPPPRRLRSATQVFGLVLLLSVLFCAMASVILNDMLLGISVVYGTFFFLGFWSLFFSTIIWLISRLPVPEHLSIGHLTLATMSTALSIGLIGLLPTFGGLLLIVSLLGYLVILFPRSWKVNLKMALRNIGRQRARTTATMLALFVGVFSIGLILALGQNLSDKINTALANSLSYNLMAVTSGKDTQTLQSHLGSIAGVSASLHRPITTAIPQTIDGVALSRLVPQNDKGGSNDLGRASTLYFMSGFEGFDVVEHQFPDPQNLTITEGRNLNASDVGSNHVLVAWPIVHMAPLNGHLKVGSTITFTSLDGKTTQTVIVVGVYENKTLFSNIEPILSTSDLVKTFSPVGKEDTVTYMKVSTTNEGKVLSALGSIVPNAAVFNQANFGDLVNQYLGDILEVLVAVASLSLLAGMIIIANVVALAMLERRRELGILKSVGYTSKTLLGEVMIENGIVGGTGALLAMLLVALVMALLGKFVFQSDFGVNSYTTLSVIAGVSVLAVIIAVMVSWKSLRVPPLEVLRYE